MNDIQNNQNLQKIADNLNTLIEESNQIGMNIDENSKNIEKRLDAIETNVKESIQKIDRITSDINNAEKGANEEIDKLLIKQSKDVAQQQDNNK